MMGRMMGMSLLASFLQIFGSIVIADSVATCPSIPCAPDAKSAKKAKGPKKPNIIFVIVDDLGIDQLELFGYGGLNPRAATPALAGLANAGVRFRNFWAAPDCSPSRTAAFTGRYPIRTNVTTALLDPDLAGNQPFPYELTTPNVLRRAGYKSAMFGKAHLANSPSDDFPLNSPYNATQVTQLGWDYFNGWNDGGPLPIDTTAGGAGKKGQYSCGFVTGSVSGACHFLNGTCVLKHAKNLFAGTTYPGLTCLAEGGILLPGQNCINKTVELNFDNNNGYYVGQAIIIPDRQSDAEIYPPGNSDTGRVYRTEREAQAAIQWINKQKKRTNPWMATVSFSAVHAPLQQCPPGMDYGQGSSVDVPCSNTTFEDNWRLMNSMIESMDRALGKVLLKTGVAFRNPDGSYTYNKDSNTVVIVMGDNGSYGPTVRLPFNPSLAKAYVYQTGVWVPMMVTGAMVDQPGRTNEEMVNVVDLFQLFGDLAGVNVHDYLEGRPVKIDSQDLLPYLTNANQPPIRNTSFAYTAENYRGINFINQACVLPSINTCTTLFFSKTACVDLIGGIWYGAGSNLSWVPEGGFTNCCDLNKAIYEKKPPESMTLYNIFPKSQVTVRSASYKLINITTDNFDNMAQECRTTISEEFYEINQKSPMPLLEDPTAEKIMASKSPNLLANNGSLTAEQMDILAALRWERDTMLSSALPCPGDVNLDGVVNAKDLAQMREWMEKTNNGSTWWDLNLDGMTNEEDVVIIKGLTP